MKVEWVPIGELLDLQRRAVDVRAESIYQEIGVRSFGRGLFVKPPLVGAELGDKRVFEIREGDFVVSNVFAWEGAVGVAAKEHDGLIGSHRFMTWTPRSDVSVEYLRHYFGSEAGVSSLGKASPGSAGRNRTLSIKNFERLVAPVPERGDQDRIAEHLTRIAATSGGTRRAQVTSLSQRDFPGETTRVSNLVEPITRQERPDAAMSYRMQGVRWYGEGMFTRETRVGADLPSTVYRIEPGDLVYNRLFAWKQSFALADRAGWASNEFPTFRVDTAKVRPRVLLAALLSPSFTTAVNQASTGSTPTSRNRLKERDFLSLPVTIPRAEHQPAIEASLLLVDQLKPLLSRTDRLSAAILPAARNEIFNSMR